MSGPATPLEPLAPSPYASVIYSVSRTRSEGGPKQPLRDLRMPSRPRFRLPVRGERQSLRSFERVAGRSRAGFLRSRRPLGTGAKTSKVAMRCQLIKDIATQDG